MGYGAAFCGPIWGQLPKWMVDSSDKRCAVSPYRGGAVSRHQTRARSNLQTKKMCTMALRHNACACGYPSIILIVCLGVTLSCVGLGCLLACTTVDGVSLCTCHRQLLGKSVYSFKACGTK